MKKALVLSALLILGVTTCTYAGSNYSYKQEIPSETTSPIKGQVVYIPIGTTTEAVVSTPISSET